MRENTVLEIGLQDLFHGPAASPRGIILKNAQNFFKGKGDALQLVTDTGKIPDSKARGTAIEKNVAINTRVRETTKHTVTDFHNTLRNRINRISMVNTINKDNVSPVASGDDNPSEQAKTDVWFMPIYHQANQRRTSEDFGYKVKSGGGIIGIDTKSNDDQTIIGAAFSVIKSDILFVNEGLQR
ncbi:MAG: autotransporter outer membrane beta-barrel domain-containing protein [Rickettsia endosymbiont of Bryobia graminum]|nr:autotransporter outer membrane beta-barrel domain-containing protein [Rickettsia endosymbiont of Bryobia graminum]